MLNHVGKMLLALRLEKGISQAELANGITSVTQLSKIETGVKEADWLLLQALFQRVGKSVDKLELTVSCEEYQLFEMKRKALEQLLAGISIKRNLEEYHKKIDASERLYVQSYLQLEAAEMFLQGKDKAECICQLEKALAVTFTGWKQPGCEKNYFCVQEIEIVLMILYLVQGSQLELKRLLNYIEDHFTDAEERVKLYPKCAWLIAKSLLKEGNVEKAYAQLCLGEKCLAQNGSLTFMRQILELEIKCLEQLKKKGEKEKKEKYLEAIDFAEQIAGVKQEPEIFFLFMFSSQQSEVMLSNELIRELRVSQKLSQAELGAGICERETLSRIESGKRRINRKNFYKLLDKMNVNRHTYYGFIVAEDYSLYEKVREFNRTMAKGNGAEAEQILEELKEKLDLEEVVNRQFVETMECNVGKPVKENYERTTQKLLDILSYTMDVESEIVSRTPFRLEFMILNRIALCQKRIGRLEDSIDIYEKILQKYESSKVCGECHSVTLALLYRNYIGVLEEANRIGEAEKLGLDGIKLTLSCQRGDFVGKILANLSSVYGKDIERKEKEEKYLRKSYYLLSLYKNNCKILSDAYEDKYARKLQY